jgi:muramoyltetrapeptide carboxypeptidase
MVTFHGPNLDQVRSQYTFDRLKTAVTSRQPLPALSVSDSSDTQFVPAVAYAPIGGRVDGLSIGGNLTALVSLMGTPFQPEFDQHILFLEDMNERNDVLDRWLTNLYVSGHLQRTAGVVFGEFVGCGTKSSYTTLSLEDLFGARLKMLSKPSCFGMPVGQSHHTATVPIGLNASFDADNGRLEFTDSALD